MSIRPNGTIARARPWFVIWLSGVSLGALANLAPVLLIGPDYWHDITTNPV